MSTGYARRQKGLTVDRKAAEWPEDEICCDEEGMARSDQIVIPPAH
jgi:hypothetical protein